MFKKVISCLLILMMPLSLAACGKTTAPKAEETGYILTHFKSLPDSITNISRCFPDGDKLCLCCWEEGDEENTAYYAATVHTDGSDFQKLPLELDTTAVLLDIAPDGHGGLWGLRMAPNGDESPDYALCRFGSDGGLTAEIPLNGLMEEADALRWTGKDLFLNTDRDGNLCVIARDGKTSCFLFDRRGDYLFTLKDSGDPRSVIAMAAGPAVSSPGIVIPSTMDRAAPRAAPEDTPSVEPSASGLRSRPCIAAPHRLRAAPISPAQSTRGRRVHQMMER